ncbi:MAG: HIT family protein [Candidatus Paceibacterota bacterium]|jgi:histidine triad (HIT) family protein
MACLFCDIIAKHTPAHIVYEDDAVVATLDIFPRAVGHTLVLPKKHAQNILELADSDIGPVFTGVKNVTALLEKALAPHGFTIGINHGSVSGQVVEHLHIHIIPRFEGDGGGSIHGVVNDPPAQSLEEVARMIAQKSL